MNTYIESRRDALPDVAAVLPTPFEWVFVPGGQVTLDHRGGYLAQNTTFDVAPFVIGKYPVTAAQYQAFVDAPDGYRDPIWWVYSSAAYEWRAENENPVRPPYGGGDHPRTHITWYEAVAFCRWLTEAVRIRSGAFLSISLPTEQQWQRAAQGDDGRIFAWGNAWDASRCKNNLEKNSIGPAPVTEYAGKGDSPFGAVDMTGNVWEWCLTSWGTGANDPRGDDVRVLRGGSWFDDVMSFFGVMTRSSWSPDIRSDMRGFRLVCPL